MKSKTNNIKYIFSSYKRKDRGIALIYTTLFLTVIMVMAGFAIDMSYIDHWKSDAQRAADISALAGDWALAHGKSDADAKALAIQAASNLYYDNNTYPDVVTVTLHSKGYVNNVTVDIKPRMNMYFSYITGLHTQTITAHATASFTSYQPITFDPKWYGVALAGPFCLNAYGPDQGATRGDAHNTRWVDITNAFPKDPNPLNWDLTSQKNPDKGVDYFLNLSSTTTNSNNSTYVNAVKALGIKGLSDDNTKNCKCMVQIYDPQTYVHNSSDSTTVDQLVNQGGSTVGTSVDTNEKWRYTLYNIHADGTRQQVATAVYGELGNDANLEHCWVTPTGFSFDATQYATSTFVVNVRTDDGNGNPGEGYDKNGFLLRAGPDYTSVYTTNSGGAYGNYCVQDVRLNDSTKSTCMTDSLWNSKFSSLTTMGALNDLVVTAYNAGTGDMYFGNIPPNPDSTQPTVITFNGFDQDSGCSALTFTCDSMPGTTFQGSLSKRYNNSSGNGYWSDPGPQRLYTDPNTQSNTIYFPPGTYTGGNWTVHYTTGQQDVTTWNWTLNYGSGGNYPFPRLIYTDPGSSY